MEALRIGQVAKATGVSVRAIRHYDQSGLLTAERADNRYRIFQAQDIERVRLIQLFLGVGFSLDEIRRWAPCFAGGRLPDDRSPHHMTAFYTCKVALLDTQIMALQHLRDKLTNDAVHFEAQAESFIR